MDLNLTPQKIFERNIVAQRIMAESTIGRVIGASKSTPMASRSSFGRSIDEARANRQRHVGGHAGSGGLQNHSVGGLYPWLPVGHGDGLWSVHNASTGQQTPAVFASYTHAAEWAERFQQNPSEMGDFNREALLRGYTFR